MYIYRVTGRVSGTRKKIFVLLIKNKMPAKKTPGSKSKRRSPSRKSSSRTRKSKANTPKSMFVTKSMSYTSTPQKGEPYGIYEEVTIKNGKGDKVYGKLDKSGKKINTIKTKINNSGLKCAANNIRPALNLSTLMQSPIFNAMTYI